MPLYYAAPCTFCLCFLGWLHVFETKRRGIIRLLQFGERRYLTTSAEMTTRLALESYGNDKSLTTCLLYLHQKGAEGGGGARFREKLPRYWPPVTQKGDSDRTATFREHCSCFLFFFAGV